MLLAWRRDRAQNIKCTCLYKNSISSDLIRKRSWKKLCWHVWKPITFFWLTWLDLVLLIYSLCSIGHQHCSSTSSCPLLYDWRPPRSNWSFLICEWRSAFMSDLVVFPFPFLDDSNQVPVLLCCRFFSKSFTNQSPIPSSDLYCHLLLIGYFLQITVWHFVIPLDI